MPIPPPYSAAFVFIGAVLYPVILDTLQLMSDCVRGIEMRRQTRAFLHIASHGRLCSGNVAQMMQQQHEY